MRGWTVNTRETDPHLDEEMPTQDTPLDEWLEALDEMESAGQVAFWQMWWQAHCDPSET